MKCLLTPVELNSISSKPESLSVNTGDCLPYSSSNTTPNWYRLPVFTLALSLTFDAAYTPPILSTPPGDFLIASSSILSLSSVVIELKDISKSQFSPSL